MESTSTFNSTTCNTTTPATMSSVSQSTPSIPSLASNSKSFKEYLSLLDKSQNTISAYLTDVNQYFSNFSAFTRENILNYRRSISQLSAATINRKLSSLRQYNEYLINTNQALPPLLIVRQDYVRIQDKGNPTNISEKTVLTFLHNIKTTNRSHQSRNIAIIYLIANTGIRRAECCNIKLSDLNLTRHELHIIGKGSKERFVALNKTAEKVINNYLEDRKKSRFADSEYLFLSERGTKLVKESINKIFNCYSTEDCKVHPHALRHNWCTTMLENGILSLIEVKNQVGHSSIKTTAIYTHARRDKIEEKIRSYSIG